MLPYIVQPGDTLLRIAKRCNINLCALLAANPQLSPDRPLQPGLLLSVPVKRNEIYSVQTGDTWLSIAKRFDCSLQELYVRNPRLDPKRLIPGQLVHLTARKSKPIVDTRAEYGHRELEGDLSLLVHEYPFLTLKKIGESVLGKPLQAVRLGSGKKKVHINAAMHANEWITTPLLMRFIEEAAHAYAEGEKLCGINMRNLLQELTIWFVPLVNPDGAELVIEGIDPKHERYNTLIDLNHGFDCFTNWKANIRGVDLNDQFPAFWEEEVKRREVGGPGARDYPGEAPLSEPEAAALACFTREEQFDLAIALHTQGKEIYWNYRGYEPPESEMIADRMGKKSSYKPVQLKGSDAGYKDWFIYEFRKPGFTVELGSGVNPLPLEEIPGMYHELKLILFAGLAAAAEL